MTTDTAAGAGRALRSVLSQIEAGDLPAELDHAAYLRGAADALALTADTRPDTFASGHQDDDRRG